MEMAEGEKAANGEIVPDRSAFTTWDTVRHIWTGLSLPEQALDSLVLEGSGQYYQTSFKVSQIAQSSIALSALSAALVHSLRHGSSIPRVTIPLRHACLEFQTERLFSIDGKSIPSAWGPIGGLHSAADGHVRIHDSFPNHRNGTLKLLGLDEKATREEVSREVIQWKKLELEDAGYRKNLAIYSLRSYREWDATPQAKAVSNFPILIRKINGEGPKGFPANMEVGGDRCLQGLRVLELSRVISAPVAGKTLAAHGAGRNPSGLH